MKPKMILAGALLLAFFAGAILDGYIKPGLSKALTVPATTVRASSPAAARPVQNTAVYSESPAVRHHRTLDREVLIVAGSSGAGTAIGALAGGKKGAGIGALSGAIAGLTYDLLTRNK